MTEKGCYRDFSAAKKASLWQRFRDGDEEARSILLESNFLLVQKIAARFCFAAEYREDLFHAGVLGLMAAAEGFEPARGTDFALYAFPFIKGEVLRAQAEIKGEKKGFYRKKAKETAKNGLPLPAVAALTEISLEELTAMAEDLRFADDTATAMLDKVEERLLLAETVAVLSEEERRLLYFRYVLNKSQAETGAAFALSQTRISRREKEILAKLRRTI